MKVERNKEIETIDFLHSDIAGVNCVLLLTAPMPSRFTEGQEKYDVYFQFYCLTLLDCTFCFLFFKYEYFMVLYSCLSLFSDPFCFCFTEFLCRDKNKFIKMLMITCKV